MSLTTASIATRSQHGTVCAVSSPSVRAVARRADGSPSARRRVDGATRVSQRVGGVPATGRSLRVPLRVAPAPRGARAAGVVFAGGAALVIVVGAGLLLLPTRHAEGAWTPLLDAAVTAVPAARVTGLVAVDTG